MNALVPRFLKVCAPAVFLTVLAQAGSLPPSQVYYVPFPEEDQLAGFVGVSTAAVDPLAVFVTFSASADNTVIYYDHWEDGYESDITHPQQSTTQVFGDGNSANGYPPGNAGDLISAGTLFSLRNYVDSTAGGSVFNYDARDKIASFKPISLTKTSFPASTNTLLAGCVEVFERGLWGTQYRVPVGVDMPTSTATSTLAWDADSFGYAALSIMAGAGGANVQIDADNDGSFEQTVPLAEGGTTYVTGVNVGGSVVSDNPVQVVLFTGRPGSNYQSRSMSLLPEYRWSSSYYAPVSTSASYGTAVFLYNPGSSEITVSYDYRDSGSSYATSTISVPAGGNARVNLSPGDGSTHFGAYHFHTTGGSPATFYALCAVDAASSSTGSNQAYDGGFTLVGQPSLTTQVLLSLGIGRDPYSSTNPSENGNPVWVTTVGNGHVQETVYVDFNGDNAGDFTDPNGNHYDVSYSARELEQLKIFDPDGDQGGMLVYVLNPDVKVAAAWAQDPTAAATGQPGLDVATLIPPLREGDAAKGSSIAVDADGDGHCSAGDTLEYDIRTINTARANINGPFTVKDNLPAEVSYVPGSTKYRFSVGGAWQAWVAVPDDGGGTLFPLDGAGYDVPGLLNVGQQIEMVFQATIKTYAELNPGTSRITNTGSVIVTPYGVTVGLEWSDQLFGSIGDRVWNDLNGDGVQDPGELGVSGVEVYADVNSNGVRDPGESWDVTDSNGDYLLAGLVAGTYAVQVSAVDISAVNVGYGPSYDIDGVATSHVATVSLAASEARRDVDFGYRVGASVGDRVWLDLDADGHQDPNEPGINGIRVYVDSNNNNAYDSGEPNTITSGAGTYYIGNLDPGTISVRVDSATLPSGLTQTYDLNGGLDNEAAVTLLAAEHHGDLDFGYRGTLSIGDLVWEDGNSDGSSGGSITYNVDNGRIDLNGDGSHDNNDDGFIGTMRIINGYVDIDNDNSTPVDNGDDGTFLGVAIVNGGFDLNGNGSISSFSSDDGQVAYATTEPGIAGVRVFVDTNGNGTFDPNELSAVTDSNGNYAIGGLYNGTFTVRVDLSTLPASYVQTYDLTSPVTDYSATVTLAGASRSDVDFGFRNDASLGDLVWNDRNADGVRDAGEPGIEGVLVYIDDDNDNGYDQGGERFAVTDVDGYYVIENLAAGSYNIRVEFSTLAQGSTQTYDSSGSLDHEASRTLAVSEDATDVDFGYRSNATFGDFVWFDLDGDGLQDPGETGIGGVRVFVDINGNGLFESATEPSAVTDSAGAYSIANLMPGVYTARVDATTLPVGLTPTFDLAGALDGAATFSITANQTRADIDFGYTSPVTIGNLVWNDLNANGVQDSGEPGIDEVNVTVYNADFDTVAGTTTTAEGGSYVFSSLPPGTYYVVFDAPSGFVHTLVDQDADDVDSDANETTGRTPNLTLAGGQSDLTVDAGFYQPGSISGLVLADTDADGDGDVAIVGVVIQLLDSAGSPVLDGFGSPVTTSTASDGGYVFTGLPPGDYRVAEVQPPNHASVSDVDGPNDNVIGNVTLITVSPGSDSGGNDFIEIELGAISGSVFMDTTNDGLGDTAFPGVALTLLDGSGNPVDGDSGTPGVQQVTVSTGIDGSYRFEGLFPGDYQVSETQPPGFASVSDADGGNLDVIGSLTPISVAPGQEVTERDFIEIELGAISGYVFEGLNPLAGVQLVLLDGFGNPVDSNFSIPGVQPFTATTNGSGFYRFSGVIPGTYQVSEVQPFGYDSFGDADGGDPDVIGDNSPIVLAPGGDSLNNNFVETLDTCPDDWAEWKFQHPSEQADGNPDADAYDNLAEFAFAMPADNGTGNNLLGGTAWIIQPSGLVPGTLEGVFVRPKGATDNVLYTLQYAAAPGNPTVWQSIVIIPSMITVVDNGDCTETVTIDGLEAVTGLTGGNGIVRIKAELDEEPDAVIDHTSYTEVEGWKETDLEPCCRTYNNPFLRETTFTGTVSGVSGQDIVFTTSGGSADLATISGSGSFYLEVTSGENEGHRFDVASASGNTITLAADADIHAAAAPFNTLSGAPPADLAGDEVVIRRHWTIDETFPPSGFGATGSQSDADQIQIFAGGAWTIYWLYDENDADPGTARWVDAADAGMADQGAAVIQPGQGIFFNNRTSITSILAYGEVRENDFIRPLAVGNNLVGGGYPIDQSAAGTGGRAMNLADGFFGSRDFKTADSFFLWNADTTIGAAGYSTYFLLNGAPVQPSLIRWVKVGDASLQARDAEVLLLGNRSVFVRTKEEIPSYSIPSPWNP